MVIVILNFHLRYRIMFGINRFNTGLSVSLNIYIVGITSENEFTISILKYKGIEDFTL